MNEKNEHESNETNPFEGKTQAVQTATMELKTMELKSMELKSMELKSNATVFVVDDEAVVRESLQWLITSIGLHVETYASAVEFLDAYDPQTPGCLVLDVRMPDISGLDLQDILRERGNTIPIIIVTGYADVPMAVRAMKNKAMEFLRKPYSDQQMLDVVQKAIQADADYREKHVRSDELRQRFKSLTPREHEVVDLVVEGLSSRVIAERLDISQKTVETHRTHIMKKLQAGNVAQLTHLYFELKAANA